ncbi:MAG: helix-hairpin-helix domain-containing protein [Pseudomonadota bacterium]|nr:helix-hairpin-helix domain-containing protein [Pseudomonadota bacterium]
MGSRIFVLLGALLISFSVLASPVNVNKASSEEIAIALKGIGPSKAEAIKDYCKTNKCTKAEDLLNVKGIGQKTLDKIKEDLRF